MSWRDAGVPCGLEIAKHPLRACYLRNGTAAAKAFSLFSIQFAGPPILVPSIPAAVSGATKFGVVAHVRLILLLWVFLIFLNATIGRKGGLKYRWDKELDCIAFTRRRVGEFLIDNGLTIAGRRFDFLAYSQSALKEHAVWSHTPAVANRASVKAKGYPASTRTRSRSTSIACARAHTMKKPRPSAQAHEKFLHDPLTYGHDAPQSSWTARRGAPVVVVLYAIEEISRVSDHEVTCAAAGGRGGAIERGFMSSQLVWSVVSTQKLAIWIFYVRVAYGILRLI
ncbi:RNA-dependent RNA polymerase [Mycena sanguinolenta]|uniref:RNA-dependent RNA polymerase n=1 Tax=Mycena sanguinolenta TaxID=230812 RepID=A0A8H6YA20_9AGAR|nr:RNA-dependent RNA polymerase [Mycena sanguinolenta]